MYRVNKFLCSFWVCELESNELKIKIFYKSILGIR